jgi:hypothetical protein
MTTSCGRSSCAWRSASSRSLPGVEAEGTSPDDEGSLEELIPIVRRSLDSGDHLALMGLASATLAIVRDLFDDDEWLLAGMRFVDDGRAAFRVSVDHGAEGAVVDAVLMRQTVDEVRQQLRATAPEYEVAITDVSASELAERYADAVAAGEDARTDTWPSSRPLIEWALRLG